MASEKLSEYEKKRLENIRKNQEILAALQIPILTDSIPKVTASTSGKAPSKKRTHAKSPPPGERRISSRVQERLLGVAKRMSVAEELAMYRDLDGRAAMESKQEKPPRPKRILDVIPFDPEMGATEDFLDTVKSATSHSCIDGENWKTSKYSGSRKYTIDGAFSIAKVVQDRIYSVAIHPSREKILATAGSKMGSFSLWDATDAHLGVATERKHWHFQPHQGAISNQRYNPVNDSQLFMTSYDATIRCLDITRGEFSILYSAKEDEQYISAFDHSRDGNLLYFTDTSGTFTRIDLRAASSKTSDGVSIFQLHGKKAGGMSTSPADGNLLATSSLDDTICIWDMRNLQPVESPMLARFEYRRAVTSVYFHPVIKDSLVSTCYDDRVRIHTQILGDRPMELEIIHNNQTGRWITPFRAIWDPKSTALQEESHVLIGDMSRGISVIEMDSGVVCSSQSELLTAQPAANAIHPNLDLVVSGTAGGKCVLWKPTL